MPQGADQDPLRAPSGAGFGRSGQLTRSPEEIRPRPGQRGHHRGVRRAIKTGRLALEPGADAPTIGSMSR